MGLLLLGILLSTPVLLLILYIRLNDSRLKSIPPDALAVSPKRWTEADVRSTAARLDKAPLSVRDQLGPRTGRRYIVVGGVSIRILLIVVRCVYCVYQAGFLGGWIVNQLLERGEDPKRIRVLDLRTPTRKDLLVGAAKEVHFIQVNVSNAVDVQAAFSLPWPTTSTSNFKEAAPPPLTVFHTAANIRFYERHPALVGSSAKVNVVGTQNIVNAARKAGATVMVYTSSGSVGVHRSRFWLWPWEKLPKYFVQVINDEEGRLPKRHEEFFSNYAVTKRGAERIVRDADKTVTGVVTGDEGVVLRTGCIRPGNGVFGPRGDMLVGAYLVRQTNPTWISSVMQSFTYVENCAVAHLNYEQRLIELASRNSSKKCPDIGGQAFTIADPGPTPTYGDVYDALTTLTDGECHFPNMSPTAMLLLAHLVELYYLSRYFLPAWAAWLLPPINGDLINLQPSLFALTSVHLLFDDARARLGPEEGGLGYRGAWTTLEGVVKTFKEHKSGVGGSEERSGDAGVSFGFGMARAQRGVGRVREKVVAG